MQSSVEPARASLQERLTAALNSIGAHEGESEEREQRILHERAVALAREITTADDSEEFLETVDFVLGGEVFGVEVAYVREIHPLREVTRLPCTPAFVAGIINLRGKILSVIDIRKFFDLPDGGITDLNKAIITGDGDMEFGILADHILDVHRTPVREIQSSLPTLTGIRQDYLRGVTNARVAILDVRKLLNDERIVVYDKA